VASPAWNAATRRRFPSRYLAAAWGRKNGDESLHFKTGRLSIRNLDDWPAIPDNSHFTS
jgi:hypothetical protein